MGTLYMVPMFLGAIERGEKNERNIAYSFPSVNISVIRRVKFFLVEEIRTARRFLKSIDGNINIDELQIVQFNKDTAEHLVAPMLKPLLAGNDIAVISEAGCPGIADPGALAAREAHKIGARVVPLIGPSSILLGLMASGLDGQNFSFNGYLPVKQPELLNSIRNLEAISAREHRTQMFIETPYRNKQMLLNLTNYLRPTTLLCVAADVATPSEYIRTLTVREWKGLAEKVGDELHKRPAIFMFLA